MSPSEDQSESSAGSHLSRRRAAPMPPSERRAAIVQAVLPLLIEHGSAATSRQFAEAAGVSEGTIFSVFADKDELLQAAVTSAVDPAPFEHNISKIDSSLSFEGRLLVATELIQQRIVDIWRLVSGLEHQHPHPKHKAIPDSQALTALMDSAPGRLSFEPSAAARHLRAVTLALSHPMMVEDPRSAAEIVHVFLHGVEANA